MTRWLVVIEDDVEPRLEGPFRSDQSRTTVAGELRATDIEGNNGLFRLDVNAKGVPRIYPFLSHELDSELT